MLMAVVPVIGVFFHKLHLWWHNKFHHDGHEIENKFDPFARPSDSVYPVSEEDMEYLRGEPVPLKITIPVEIERDEQDS